MAHAGWPAICICSYVSAVLSLYHVQRVHLCWCQYGVCSSPLLCICADVGDVFIIHHTYTSPVNACDSQHVSFTLTGLQCICNSSSSSSSCNGSPRYQSASSLPGKAGALSTPVRSFHVLSHERYVLQAQEQLFCARRILGNSYVAAYYFYGNDMFADEISPEQNELNQNLFEDQQQQLEMEVTIVILMFTPVNIAGRFGILDLGNTL